MEIPLYQIDALASELFAGNPAAVCPLDELFYVRKNFTSGRLSLNLS